MPKTAPGTLEGFTLIELLIVVSIISILSAIAIPQYAAYRKGAQDNAAEAAYHSIAMAQEAYFTYFNRYTTNYSAGLAKEAGLVKDPNVIYGNITLYTKENVPGYKFQVNHKAPGSSLYTYDSVSSVLIDKKAAGIMTSSTW
jgi:prepilin-type N-terminal cleavage/methylation domain-containing protein